MAKMKKRHFHTRTTRPNHQPPHPQPNHHHFLPQTTTPQPPLHHPNHHHYQPQPHYSNYENTLVEEVIYLHSLWHRGPPPSSSSRTNFHLKPSPTTHFKKTPTRVSDKEWLVPNTHIPESGAGSGSGSSWPEFCNLNQPVSRPATDEERVRVMGVRIQSKGVDSCSGLLRRGDDNDDEEDEEDDDDNDKNEIEAFENLFGEDKELRGFYKDNCETGEFYCLVCGVFGKHKLGRKYKSCVALVQHSVSVSKTKKKKAHRAFGNVVCKVLGLDVDSLPFLPLPSVSKTIEGAKEEVKNHADEDSTVVGMEMDGEREIARDALVKDNVTTLTTTDAGCMASEVTRAEGEVKSLNGKVNTAVEMVWNTANASQSQADPEGIPNASERDDGASMDARCVASGPTQSEAERKDGADGGNINDTLGRNFETDVSQRQNDPELPQVNAVRKVEEECSVPGIKPLESESSLAGNDPFEELQSLPGVFQIPE